MLRTETTMDLPPGCPSQFESLQNLHHVQKTALTDIRSLWKDSAHQPSTMGVWYQRFSSMPS